LCRTLTGGMREDCPLESTRHLWLSLWFPFCHGTTEEGANHR
jgi:hypothetical protein